MLKTLMTLISSKHLTLMSLGEVYSFRSNEVGRLTRCAEQFFSHNLFGREISHSPIRLVTLLP